ncbi:Crp/Fnr family transcriptional regulator [Fervidobacterium thailandense]|uniref:Crp/Fnr family transcriptional regulator n=2 Tax=Fervidobacterium thailandense TaxID=1008305 RepID=A0A1E3G456_9BACT|nr:Crp/Fnr family transcriptional regulator [Fervidobacterium thailandense]
MRMNPIEKKRITQNLIMCEVFEGLGESFVEEILRIGQIERYRAKEIVRSRGDSCEEVLILVHGEVYGLFTNSEGRVLQIDHMTAPKLLAAAVIFSTDSKYPVDVETVKDSTFLRIERESFIGLMMNNEKLLRNYLRFISDTFMFITDRFYEITMKNLVQKVCGYLLKLMNEQQSTSVVMHMTKEELAREFGVSRPALSRVFIELEKLGVIESEGKKIKIKDERYLRDYAQFGY